MLYCGLNKTLLLREWNYESKEKRLKMQIHWCYLLENLQNERTLVSPCVLKGCKILEYSAKRILNGMLASDKIQLRDSEERVDEMSNNFDLHKLWMFHAWHCGQTTSWPKRIMYWPILCIFLFPLSPSRDLESSSASFVILCRAWVERTIDLGGKPSDRERKLANVRPSITF